MNKIEKQVIENAKNLDKIIEDGLYIVYCGGSSMRVFTSYEKAYEDGLYHYKSEGFVVRQLTSVIPKFPDYVKV